MNILEKKASVELTVDEMIFILSMSASIEAASKSGATHESIVKIRNLADKLIFAIVDILPEEAFEGLRKSLEFEETKNKAQVLQFKKKV